MFVIPGEESGLEFIVAPNAEQLLTTQEIAKIAQASNTEDMRAVTADDIIASERVVAAYDRGTDQLIGFARQTMRGIVELDYSDRREAKTFGEIGTLWTDPAYRKGGRRIGRTLVHLMAKSMTLDNVWPLAICNETSRRTFEPAGFATVGMLPLAPSGHQRVVEMYRFIPTSRNRWQPTTRVVLDDESLGAVQLGLRSFGTFMDLEPSLPASDQTAH